MIKVEKLKRIDIKNLLSNKSPNYSGILTGVATGEIWVDSVETPHIAIVYSPSIEGFSVMGKSNNLNKLKNVSKFLIDRIPDMNFSVESEKVKNELFKLFSERKIGSEMEYFFRYSGDKKEVKTLPKGYSLTFVDRDFLQRDNLEMLKDRIIGSWGSFDNFLNKSIAFAILYNNEIVAVIVGTSRYKNLITIDIETSENHRKKGLASILTGNFINKAVEMDLICQWNCIESNKASRKTAERAGFTLLHEDEFYWFE